MVDLENLKLHALEESKKSAFNFKHGCVIIRNGKIVATGFNDHRGHAENNALNQVYRLLCRSREEQKG